MGDCLIQYRLHTSENSATKYYAVKLLVIDSEQAIGLAYIRAAHETLCKRINAN